MSPGSRTQATGPRVSGPRGCTPSPHSPPRAQPGGPCSPHIATWHVNTLRRCTGSLCTPYSSSSLFHPSFRAILPVLVETYSGDLTHIETCVCVCPTLCSPMDSSVHGILQAKILEWGCHALLQGIFPTQGSKPHLLCLLHCRWILYLLTHWESPGSNKTFQENRSYLSFLECTLIFSYPISFLKTLGPAHDIDLMVC